MGILKKERDFVLPGDKIVESLDYLPGKNCFRDGNSIYSKRVGLVSFKGRVIEVIPLTGMYIPEPGDMIIGEIKDVQFSGWAVDINSPYQAFLPLSGVREFIDPAKMDLSKVYGIGELIYAKVTSVGPSKGVNLSMRDPSARKFKNGRIIKITPVKVPRVIGKKGSMINLIKERTACRIYVGQNGVIWLQGENEPLAAKAIKMIEEMSHIEGLTNYIENLLKNEGKIKGQVMK
ncbi:MAG: RNA-binding protein [Candidatus Aenigmarchaeota archaeon]|nr:RNA-binding protein [Candidatus Aenigmarchaeota archaeon]